MSITTGNVPKGLVPAMPATPNRPADALARLTAPATPVGGSKALVGLQSSVPGVAAFHPGAGAAFQKRAA